METNTNVTKCCNCEPCHDECKDAFFSFAEDTACNFVEVWNARYGGAFIDQNSGDRLFIKQVIYQKPEVVIFWNDETKSTAHCAKEDTYNMEMGLLVAVMERIIGKANTDQLFTDWLPTTYFDNVDTNKGKYVVNISDVRKRYKKLDKQFDTYVQSENVKAIKEYLESCGYKVEKK